MKRNDKEIIYKSLSEVEKNLFPNYFKEKIKKQQKENGFKDFHMDETIEIVEYLKGAFKKIN